ncbi:DUF3829 domain-containing protein [Pseudomonas sp. KNUC1026]|uniref:DUF3829 domain-containing protein n=1 Tax=Pseudomonas sp. KNUC1026 TaxID=2893890 RepID=UPI001F427C63|nr:DUF3829 domain-containing protein [Pseudomonas sp. KNUC1026]UFH48213.1 YiiG family protein [Pseudomonas sp. KNUC1026]
MDLRRTLAATLVCTGLLLSGCGNGENANKPGSEKRQEQASRQQTEVEKYNAYVDAANTGPDFSDVLQAYEKYIPAKLASGKPLDDYYSVSGTSISRQLTLLSKALAIPYDMPELDAPAKAMTKALGDLQPIQAQLGPYGDSKGYLADGGQKAREMQPAFIDAMHAVIAAQGAFYDGLQKRDEINTQAAFDRAEKDTPEYFRAGIVLAAKKAMRSGRDFFSQPGNEETVQAFERDIDTAADRVQQWDAKVRIEQPQGCDSNLSPMNQFISDARSSIQHARRGDYQNTSPAGAYFSAQKRDAESFQQSYANLINALNRGDCRF